MAGEEASIALLPAGKLQPQWLQKIAFGRKCFAFRQGIVINYLPCTIGLDADSDPVTIFSAKQFYAAIEAAIFAPKQSHWGFCDVHFLSDSFSLLYEYTHTKRYRPLFF